MSRFKSLSNPAININKITPNSANDEIKLVGLTIFKIAGPIIIPATNCPTTDGRFIFAKSVPIINADNKMMGIDKI
ncbi:hypothetical protein NRIC0776_08120 [Apilactobacillus kunkeei]